MSQEPKKRTRVEGFCGGLTWAGTETRPTEEMVFFQKLETGNRKPSRNSKLETFFLRLPLVTSAAPNLVLVHGWAADRRIWSHQLALVSGAVHLWAPDLPEWQADWLWQGLQRFEPGATVLVGWSLGGMLALEAAARGFRPRALVLVATCASFCLRGDYPHGWPTAVVRALRQQVGREPVRVVRDFWQQLLAAGEASCRERLQDLAPGEQDPAWLAAGLDYLRRTDLRPLLDHVAAANLLIIHGEADAIMPVAHAYYLQERLPAARLVVLPGAGHVPMVSRPGEVNELLAPLLR